MVFLGWMSVAHVQSTTVFVLVLPINYRKPNPTAKVITGKKSVRPGALWEYKYHLRTQVSKIPSNKLRLK